MTPSLSRVALPPRAWLFAAVLGFGLAAAPAAHAFTFEGGGGAAAGAPQNFMDLSQVPGANERPASKFNDSQTTVERGDFSLQFGAQQYGNQRSFHQRYDFNSQFDRYDPFGSR